MLLGDWFAQVSKQMGVKPCTPCQARQEKMNQIHQDWIPKIKDFLNKPLFGSSGQPPSDI